jgi:hypothetical protein
MAKMNHWRSSKLYRKQVLDWRYEHFVPDRAEKWLRAVERSMRERPRYREQRSFGLTQPSSVAAWVILQASTPMEECKALKGFTAVMRRHNKEDEI